jgi:hypothetical protein
MSTTTNPVARAALEYAERGYFVFPVMGRRGGEAAARWKAPYRVGRWSVESTRDAEQIKRWFRDPEIGVAIDCGKSGLVVLDGDHPDLLIEWAGEENLTGAPSWQGNRLRRSWIFRQPEGEPVGCPIRTFGEVKGAGGYVVAPPSPHPISGDYQWLVEGEPPVLPAVLAEKLATGAGGRASTLVEDATPEQVREFFDQHQSADRPELLASVVRKYQQQVTEGAGRYPSVRDCLVWGLEEAAAGLYPARELATALGAQYREDLSFPPVRPWDPAEWQRLLCWAVGRARLSDTGERIERTKVDVPLLEVDGAPADEVDLARVAYDREVQTRARSLMIDRDARAYLAEKEYQPAPSATNLTDLFDEDIDPTKWRVGGPSGEQDAFTTPGALDNSGLLAEGASVVLVGERKAGKTTLVLDLVRCLADGEPFLGRYPVDRPDGGVFILDYESTRALAKKWYQAAQIKHPERVYLKLLRGQPNPFSTAPGRADLIQEIRASKATVLIADPLSVLLEDLREEENDNHATRKGLDDLRRLATEAGVSEVVVVAHAGKSKERGARGASSIEDWPDAIWRLRREDEAPDAPRVFSAFGRDVDLEPTFVTFDNELKRPTLSGTLAQQQQQGDVHRAEMKAKIKTYLDAAWRGDADNTARGLRSKSQIQKAVPGLSGINDLLAEMRGDGLVDIDFGERGGKPVELWRSSGE